MFELTGGEHRARAERADVNARLRAFLDAHYDFVWRSARRLGLPADKADDAAQQVFIVASRKMAAIEAGKERGFLFATLTRTVSDMRRAAPARREVLEEPPDASETSISLEELVDQRRARAMLDQILDELPLDVRTVFVLFELEEMTTSEIASLLGVPPGTVASRLRRAREKFSEAIASRNVLGPGGAR